MSNIPWETRKKNIIPSFVHAKDSGDGDSSEPMLLCIHEGLSFSVSV